MPMSKTSKKMTATFPITQRHEESFRCLQGDLTKIALTQIHSLGEFGPRPMGLADEKLNFTDQER
jgi:hypothetical protein